MRKLGLILLVVIGAAVGLWVALLQLPDAPGRPHWVRGAVKRVHWQRPIADLSAGIAPLAMPVAGIPRETLADSWGDPRENGKRAHHGTDIIAPGGTLVVAAAPGVIEKLWTSARGGNTLYVRSPRRTWTYYYAHLAGYAPGLHEGQAVKVGDPLGFVGDTGDAGAGNFHLHFGLTRTSPDQHWYEGRDVDPYPYLAGKPAPR